MEFPFNKTRLDTRSISEPRPITITNIGNDTFMVTTENPLDKTTTTTREFIFKTKDNKYNTTARQNEPIENALLFLKQQSFIYKSFSNQLRDFYMGEVMENFGNFFLDYKKSYKNKVDRLSFYENEIYIKDVDKIGYDDITLYF
ncbi:hypothetical protein CDIK_1595 [Cucumispora dikerogammari]|nr:hypothetical protein CDIK_1595 [Cucumispora dikerogammari]